MVETIGYRIGHAYGIGLGTKATCGVAGIGAASFCGGNGAKDKADSPVPGALISVKMLK